MPKSTVTPFRAILVYIDALKGTIREYMKKHQDVFAQHYAQHIDEIYRYVFFKVRQHTETAEELTSTIFTKAWQSVDRFDSEKATFRTYIYRIAHNTVVDYYRTQKPTEELRENASVESTPGIDAALFWLDASKILSEEAYDILVLKYRNELSIEDICEVKEKTPDSIKSLLKRSRNTLQEYFANQDETLHV